MPDDFDNLSGYGPQSGGYYPTSGERDHQRRMSASAVDLMDYAAMHNAQFDRIRRSVVAPMAGGQAAGDDWLFKTRAGWGARTALAGVLNRDPFGYGSPQAMAFGLQQAVGTGGMGITNGSMPGGVSRGFGGSGFLTNEITKRLYNTAQQQLFKDGVSSTGMDQTQMGVLMSELGGRGMFRGNIATIRNGTVQERIAQARETSDPRIARELYGIKDSAGLQKRLKAAELDGDGQLADTIKRIESSSKVIDIDKGFEKNMLKSAKAASRMITTIGDVIGSKDVRQILQQSEALIGQTIRSDQDMAKVAQRMEKIKTYATTRGLDVGALTGQIQESSQAMQSALMGRGYSAPTARVLGADLAMQGSLAGGAAAGTSGMNGITGYDAGQATGVVLEGMAARLEENPELVAGATFLKTNTDMSQSSRRELQGYMQAFKGAGSAEERQQIQAQINRFIYNQTGKSAYDYVGGQKGIDSRLQDDGIRDQVTGLLGENVRQSIIGQGAQEAFGNLTATHRDALGGASGALAGMVAGSFNGRNQTQLRKILRDNPSELREFLQARKGSLVDGAGNAVSVDEMMKQFGDQGSYGGKADALEAFGRQYDLLAYTKGASSEDSIREERGRAIAAQKALGGGLQKRVGKRGFLGSLMDGLLAGADGQISQGALVGVASEQAGKKGEFKDTRTATFGRDRDGNYTDVTADKLRKLMGAEGAEAFATEAGGSLEDLVSRIGKGDKAAQDALDAKINGGDYVADYLNGDNLTVVDRESYETAENSFSAKGRRAAAARLLGKDQKLKDKFMEGTDLGSDILSGISSNGLLGNLTGDNDGKYKDYAAGRLQELEEVSGGELGKSLETAIASAKAKLVNAKTSKEEKKSAQASLEKYQAAQLALGKDAAKGDNAVMENVIIKVAHFEESINKGN